MSKGYDTKLRIDNIHVVECKYCLQWNYKNPNRNPTGHKQ